MIAIATIVVWATCGPFFHYSDTWQLVINTGTTIITFLMVFLIQNSQNRDAQAMHLKLDEIIRTISEARNSMINIENLTDDQLAELQQQFEQIREECDPQEEERKVKESAAEMQDLRKKHTA